MENKAKSSHAKYVTLHVDCSLRCLRLRAAFAQNAIDASFNIFPGIRETVTLLMLNYLEYMPFFLSGVPLLECCRVDDTSPENTIVGLPPS